MTSRAALVLTYVVLGAGCASTLSTHQTAVPIPPGHVEANIATGFYAPLGTAWSAVAESAEVVGDIIEAAQKETEYQVTPEQQQRLLTLGIAAAVMPPASAQEITLRTGILPEWDVGLRYSVSAVRLDTKLRVHHWDQGADVPEDSRHNLDIALGAGVSRSLFNNPVLDALEFVQLGDFSRWDLEVPIYVSYSGGHIWRLYGAGKYIYSRTSLDATLVNLALEAGSVTGLDLSFPREVDTHFVGASTGVMLGYQYVWLTLEVTGGYTACRPFVLGQERDLGGVTLYPSVGVVLRI